MKFFLLFFLTSTAFCYSNKDTDLYNFDYDLVTPYLPIANIYDDDLNTLSAFNSFSVSFKKPVNISNFILKTEPHYNSCYSYYFYVNNLKTSVTSSLDNVSQIFISSKNCEFFFIRDFSFNFDFIDNSTDSDNNLKFNWSAFSYGFTIIAIFFLLGRGIKVILDLIKFG